MTQKGEVLLWSYLSHLERCEQDLYGNLNQNRRARRMNRLDFFPCRKCARELHLNALHN
jgi:hypothetical protein